MGDYHGAMTIFSWDRASNPDKGVEGTLMAVNAYGQRAAGRGLLRFSESDISKNAKSTVVGAIIDDDGRSDTAAGLFGLEGVY